MYHSQRKKYFAQANMPNFLRTLAVAALLAAGPLHAQPAPRAGVAGASPSFVVDDDYLMFGDAQVAPSNVFASGGRTYLQLASIRGAQPSVFAVTPTGYVPIKPTFDPPYLVFDGLEQEFVLMYPGRKFVVIRHSTVAADAPQDLPQVLFGQSRDGMKFASDEVLGKARSAGTQLQRERARLDRDRQATQELAARAEATRAEAAELQARTTAAIAATHRSVESTLKDYDKERAAAASRLEVVEQKVLRAESAVSQAAARAAEAERDRTAAERAASQEALRKAEQARMEATDMKLRAIDEAASTRRALEAAMREYQQERAASARRFASMDEKVSAAERAAQNAAARAADAERARAAGERQTAQELLSKAEAARADAAQIQAKAKLEFDQERSASSQRLASLEEKVFSAEQAARQAEARVVAEQAAAQQLREAAEAQRRRSETEAAEMQAKVFSELAAVRAESAQQLASLEDRVAAAKVPASQAPLAQDAAGPTVPQAQLPPTPVRWAIYRSDSTFKLATERWAKEAGAKFRWALQDEIDVGGEGAAEASSFGDALGQLAASLRKKGYRAFVKEVEGFVVLTEKP